MKKMKKINKKNLFVFFVFCVSTGMVVTDILKLLLATFDNKMCSWTFWGCLTFIVACIVAELSFEYIVEKLNK